MNNLHDLTTQEALNVLAAQVSQLDLGSVGADYFVSASGSAGGSWKAIMAMEPNTTVALSGDWGGSFDSGGEAIAIPSGVVLYGNFTNINVTGGSLIAYRKG